MLQSPVAHVPPPVGNPNAVDLLWFDELEMRPEPESPHSTTKKNEDDSSSAGSSDESSEELTASLKEEEASPDKAGEGDFPDASNLDKRKMLLEDLAFLGDDNVKIVIGAARLGLLHEMLALRVITRHKQIAENRLDVGPILRSTGGREKIEKRLKRFHHLAELDNEFSIVLANVSAYMYWDFAWNYKRRAACIDTFRSMSAYEMKTGKRYTEDFGMWKLTPSQGSRHIDWCLQHGIDIKGVQNVSDEIERARGVLFLARHEPEWLQCTDPTPMWKWRHTWRGKKRHRPQDMFQCVYGEHDFELLSYSLQALSENVDDLGLVLMKAVELANGGIWTQCKVVMGEPPAKKPLLNKIFSRRFIQKYVKPPPVAATIKRPNREEFSVGATKDDSHYVFTRDPELYSRSMTSPNQNPKGADDRHDDLKAIAPRRLEFTLPDYGAVGWFARQKYHLLLLGEGSYKFTQALSIMGHSPHVSSSLKTTGPSTRNRFQNLNAARIHRDHRVQLLVRQGNVYSFAWNFPFSCAVKKDDDDKVSDQKNESLILGTFCSLANLFDDSVDFDGPILLPPFKFGITLHDDQFSRWNVLQSAERAGWRLKVCCPFKCGSFPGYRPSQNNGAEIDVKNARFYVFQYRAAYLDMLQYADAGFPY